MKPNYLIIGSGKSGSTSLRYSLGEHPKIYMYPKECNFFSSDDVYYKGFEWYESLFEAKEGAVMRGEGSPTYSFRNVFPSAAPRIGEYAPDMKLLYIVRHPIERIESAWWQMRSWGNEKAHYRFNKALRLNKDWLVDSTNYWREINRYRDYFPDEQILALFFEDFKGDFASVMKRAFEFLGVDPNVEIRGESRHLNPSTSKYAPRSLLSFARSLPSYRVGRRLVPRVVKEYVGSKFLMKPINGRPRWHDDSWRFVRDELSEDTRTFLEFYGKPPDFWELRKPHS